MKRTGLDELNAVSVVAARRSFRLAARELGMSPSALSHAIAALEQRMGVRLFHRTTRSVSLSAAGEQFLARVQPALREIAEAMEAVNQFRDTPTGTLRINLSVGAARMLLTPIVLRFIECYPDMHVDLISDDRFIDIVAEGFDAGIRQLDSIPQDMIAVPCTPELRFAVVGAPSYFQTRTKPLVPNDLISHTCIRARFPSGAPYRWEFEKHGEAMVMDVSGPLTLNQWDLMPEAALQGVGLAYVSEWSVAEHITAGRLIRVLDDWTPPYPGLAVYYPGHRHVPAGLRAFIDVVREVMASHDHG
jgi:DNA-binding transcriptional LysR family regulator